MIQGNMFLSKPEWVPPAPPWPQWGSSRVALDIETHDPTLKTLGPGVRRGGYVVGVSFAIEDGPAMYLPFAHRGGDNLDREVVLSYLRDQAAQFRGTLVGANLSYDLDYLAELGIEFRQAKWFRDVQVAEPLINELRDSYSLDSLATYYSVPGKDKATLRDAVQAFNFAGNPAEHIWKLPARYVAQYAIQDVRLPLTILRYQEREIESQNLHQVYDLESKLLPVLLRMRRRGVRFSSSKLDEIEQWSAREEQLALDELKSLTGKCLKLGEVWASGPIALALSQIGIHAGNTSSARPSITAEWLASVKHPAADAVLRARRVNKIRTTFVQSLRDYAVKDRIHCIMNQLRRERDDGGLGGAAFGRLSSEHPNLQQQPARDPEIGPMWRSVFLPEEGGLWACLDYSQQEPRILTHYADLTNCTSANLAADKYRTDPTADNHTMMAALTGLPRKQAKAIFLGLCYGMGGAKLAQQCGLPTEWVHSAKLNKLIEVAGPEAKAVLEKFDRKAPYVRELADLCERRAGSVGYITTVLGRRCRFPKKDRGGFDWLHKSLNRLIQGSAADQTKAALVAADEAGFKVALQVHDELDLTVQNRKEADDLAHIMREVVKLRVPSRVDVEIGPSWGEIE